jgi:hypothetical protein
MTPAPETLTFKRLAIPAPKLKLKLRGSGMTNITPAKSENDFTCIVGQDTYQCPWFVADFLSPRIGQIHSIDPTLNEIVIKAEDSDHEFEEFLHFGDGFGIEVNETNRHFLLSTGSELGNFELYFSNSIGSVIGLGVEETQDIFKL